ncbi:MAG: permease [Pseudomonadota bacterium]
MAYHGIVWHDLVGNIGVAMIVICYFLLQMGRIGSKDLGYSLGNLVGAALVIISLLQEFNVAAFVLEAFWCLISCWGIILWFRARKFGQA